jgi:lysozyme
MILQEGDSGHYVELLQKALGITVDGQFGPKTKAAVLAFQSHNGLVADGVVGPLTQAALRGISSPPPPSNPPPVSHGGPIYGCDIYHLDDVTSFSKMKANGIEFLFCKASEGLSNDSKFVSYFSQAKAAGLIAGSYHFYNASIDQRAQAQHYWSVIKPHLAKTDLPPVFDFEKASGDYSAADGARCKVFLEEIASLSGRLPLLYMSASVYGELDEPAWMLKYPWWLARYRSEALGPGTDNWVFWQFAEAAHIPGLGNTGDKDKFRGSVDDLKVWISKT